VENLPLGRTISKVIFGSRLFGTNTPESDTDFVNIFMADSRRLINHLYVPAREDGTNKATKNTASDVDDKCYDLRHFIKQALGGQTYVLELLHAPKSCLIFTSFVWDYILEHREKLQTNIVMPFIGYCRGQAAKYSAKGEKYNELLHVQDACLSYTGSFTQGDHVNLKLKSFVDTGVFEGLTHFSVEPRRGAQAGEMYLYGPDCAFPLGRSLAEVYPILVNKLNAFGDRAKAAAAADGTDLKAYYHALRVVWELEEYLTTGRITLPSPRRAELLRVRANEWSRPFIEAWIADEILRVREIPNNLPAPDYTFWSDWLDDLYIQHAADELRNYRSCFTHEV